MLPPTAAAPQSSHTSCVHGWCVTDGLSAAIGWRRTGPRRIRLRDVFVYVGYMTTAAGITFRVNAARLRGGQAVCGTACSNAVCCALCVPQATVCTTSLLTWRWRHKACQATIHMESRTHGLTSICLCACARTSKLLEATDNALPEQKQRRLRCAGCRRSGSTNTNESRNNWRWLHSCSTTRGLENLLGCLLPPCGKAATL